MTASISGSAVSARSASTSASVAYTASAGRFLVLLASRESANQYYTAVTDDGGNTWVNQTAAPTSGTAGRRVEIWTCTTTSSLTTITATFSGTSGAFIGVYDIAGQNGVDSVGSDFRTNSAAPTPVTVTPAESTDLVIGMVMGNGSGTQTYTVSSGWTMLTPATGSVSGGYAAAYMVNPPAGAAVGPTWTFSTSAGSGMAVIALKSSSVTPGFTVSIWDGTNEQPASISFWDGTNEVSASVDSIT